MSSGHVGRRGIARLLTVCAVLFGLFLMHGSPASAAEGCHGSICGTRARVRRSRRLLDDYGSRARHASSRPGRPGRRDVRVAVRGDSGP